MTRTVFDNTTDLRSKHGKLSRPNAIQQWIAKGSMEETAGLQWQKDSDFIRHVTKIVSCNNSFIILDGHPRKHIVMHSVSYI